MEASSSRQRRRENCIVFATSRQQRGFPPLGALRLRSRGSVASPSAAPKPQNVAAQMAVLGGVARASVLRSVIFLDMYVALSLW